METVDKVERAVELVACDHVYVTKPIPDKNLFRAIAVPLYVVVEEEKIKVLCEKCTQMGLESLKAILLH